MELDIGDVRTTGLGFVVALGVLLALFYVVGINETLATLSLADPTILVFVALTAIAWLGVWSLALRTVLSILGIPVSVSKSFLILASATFANNITPFGQAGGEPFSALLISRSTKSEYETGLATIASVDALHFVPSMVLAVFGLSYYATAFTLGRRIELAAGALAMFAVLTPIAIYLLWQQRNRIESFVVTTIVSVAGPLARILPRVQPPEPAVLRRRVQSFFNAIERVATDRRGLLTALLFSGLGWVLLAVSLWLSLYALGYTAPFAVVLFIIPIGGIASVTPLPGGLGGVEAALVLLIVPTVPGVDAAAAGAAAIIHRGATYWFPILIGGSSIPLLELNNGDG